MVCQRCKEAVLRILLQEGLQPVTVGLGEAFLQEDPIGNQRQERLRRSLQAAGFELLDDKKSRLLEQIRNFIIETVHDREHPSKLKFSQLLSRRLQHDYSYLSKLFSEVEGITIEQYLIHQKIEKAKELLFYDEQSLSDIAFDLGYSSSAHLSAQFKKITGLTPTQFRRMGAAARKPLDKVGKP